MNGSNERLPPGPELDPAAYHNFESAPPAGFDDLARNYGSLFTVHEASRRPRVYAGSATDIREIFVTKRDHLEVRRSSFFELLEGEESLMCLSGDAHAEVRRLLTPPQHGAGLSHAGARIRETAREVLARHRAAKPAALRAVTEETSLRIMGDLVFGSLPEPRAERVIGAYHSTVSALAGMPTADGDTERRAVLADFLAHRDAMDAAITDELRAARAQGGSRVLGHLVAASTAETGPEAALSDRAVRDHLVTLMIAGTESTAAVLAWAVCFLTHNPAAYERAAAEAAAPATDDAAESAAERPYLQAVVAETLRLSSAVPTGFTREVVKPLEMQGHRLEPGTEVAACLHLAHHDPAEYERPDELRPERFLDRSAGRAHHLPFGVGQRRCLGAHASAFISKLVLQVCLTEEVRVTGASPVRGVAHGPTVTVPADLLHADEA